MRSDFVRSMCMLARLGVAFAFVAVTASHAAAAPITFDEAISGDLAFALPMGSPLAFDVGANTVSGNTSQWLSSTGDFDSFAFTVPSGTQLTGINLAFSTSINPGTTAGNVTYTFNPANVQNSPGAFGSVTIDLLAASPGALFGSALPLGPGTYGLAFTRANLSGLNGFEAGLSTDYTWTFTVDGPAAAVPEPASLALFATGLVGAGWRRLRGRR